MATYVVHYEYSNSGAWDTDVNQPATYTSYRQARASASEHFSRGSSNCQTRVRINNDQRIRVISDYGYSDSGWIYAHEGQEEEWNVCNCS